MSIVVWKPASSPRRLPVFSGNTTIRVCGASRRRDRTRGSGPCPPAAGWRRRLRAARGSPHTRRFRFGVVVEGDGHLFDAGAEVYFDLRRFWKTQLLPTRHDADGGCGRHAPGHLDLGMRGRMPWRQRNVTFVQLGEVDALLAILRQIDAGVVRVFAVDEFVPRAVGAPAEIERGLRPEPQLDVRGRPRRVRRWVTGRQLRYRRPRAV